MNTTRRDVLQTTTSAGAAMALGGSDTLSAQTPATPKNTVRVGVVGVAVKLHLIASVIVALLPLPGSHAADVPASAWKVGTPIVTYCMGPGFPGGPKMDSAAAAQLAEGGWNVVWCAAKDLDVVQRHGLRAMVINQRLLTPAALPAPKDLDALIDRVKKHPAFYGYYLADEPKADEFPALGKLVAHIRERDPAHLGFINLLPTYANNTQLGTTGNTVEAYTGHLRKYVQIVQPSLISYDHYQFTNAGDNAEYFLNLELIRAKSLAAGVPFLNIVQASSWVPGSAGSPSAPRVPNGDEMRYLVYTTLAYGAQGISYYVYCYPKHEGGIAQADGTPTPLYHALKPLNREFVAIGKQLQPLKSLGVYHAGMQPPGVTPLPKNSVFAFDPPVPAIDYKNGARVEGALLSRFGPAEQTNSAGTHVLVVNLDYQAGRTLSLKAPALLEVFDAVSGQWSPVGGPRVELRLAGGGGRLLRIRP